MELELMDKVQFVKKFGLKWIFWEIKEQMANLIKEVDDKVELYDKE